MIKSSTVLAFLALLFFSFSSEVHAQCDPNDRNCRARPGDYQPQGDIHGEPSGAGVGSSGGAVSGSSGGGLGGTGSYSGSGASTGAPASSAKGSPGAAPLQPVRAYLRARDIPPVGAGAYGLVVFHSRPTPASRAKLMMVCTAFVAFFPRNETSSVPLKDQMITVWPLDNPDARQAKADDCDFAINHYDLVASEEAIRDVVLVVDMSADNTQADIDNKFRFWKNNIVEDPSLWRNGWSMEGVRVKIHNFVDHYGQAMLDAIKLVGGEKKP